MKAIRLQSLMTIWIALLSLTFTAIAFYDFNPKALFVEITEERGEDGCDTDEEDADSLFGFEKIFNSENIPTIFNNNKQINFSYAKTYNLCKGYFLELIKPPLS